MSTAIVALVIVGFVAAVCLLLIQIDKKQKRKVMDVLLNRFSRLGSEFNLSFSSQEVLKDCIVGLDGIQRKLLIAKNDSSASSFVLVDLNEVKNCFVKKEYGTIYSKDLTTKGLEQYLQKISLHFQLENSEQLVDVSFYDHLQNHVYEIKELEQKAKHWEAVISKLRMPSTKRA